MLQPDTDTRADSVHGVHKKSPGPPHISYFTLYKYNGFINNTLLELHEVIYAGLCSVSYNTGFIQNTYCFSYILGLFVF